MANVDILLKSGQTAPQVGAVIQTASITLTNYIIETCGDGNADVDSEEMLSDYGARLSLIIFNRNPIITLTLMVLTGATPLTDFPKGKMSTVAGLTDYYVDDATITSVKGVRKINVTLKRIFVST